MIMPAHMPLARPAWSSATPPAPAVIRKKLPTMYDLPSDNPEDSGLPDVFHDIQPQLLKETFCPPDYSSEQIFVAKDLNLFYDPTHESWYKRPDWMAVVGTTYHYKQSQDSRRSYVLWDEPVAPFIIVELLSLGKESEDLGRAKRKAHQPPSKWEVYEKIAKVPYYVVFSGDTGELHLYNLTPLGYREVSLLQNRFWFPELKLGLGLWKGIYSNEDRDWLRWYDTAGTWISTPVEQAQQERERAALERQRAQQAESRAEQAESRAEQAESRAEQAESRAEQERHRAEQAEQRAEQERHRAAQLVAKLRALGIDLD